MAASDGRRPLMAYSQGVDTRAGEEEPRDLVRHCAKCGKTLRSNNAGDTCTACRPAGERRAKTEPAVANASRDIIRRFRSAAALFGLNPDEMISDYCQRWLSRVSSAAKGEPDGKP